MSVCIDITCGSAKDTFFAACQPFALQIHFKKLGTLEHVNCLIFGLYTRDLLSNMRTMVVIPIFEMHSLSGLSESLLNDD